MNSQQTGQTGRPSDSSPNSSKKPEQTSHLFSLVLVILLIIVAAIYVGMMRAENAGSSGQTAGQTGQVNGQLGQTGQSTAEQNTQSLEQNSVNAAVASTAVEIPLLVDANDPMFAGQISGCDKVVMTSEPLPPQSATTSPVALLNLAYQTLFADRSPWPPVSDAAPGAAGETAPLPGNFIETQTALHFDHASIQNAIAYVYLTGATGPLSGECDDPRLATQINATALQFPAVQSVQVYLNNASTSLTFSDKN